MGVRHEELLQKVEQREGSTQLMAQPWLLAASSWPPLIHAGSTRLRRGLERQQLLQNLGTVGHQLPRPLRRAEERTAGQHDIGEHT